MRVFSVLFAKTLFKTFEASLHFNVLYDLYKYSICLHNAWKVAFDCGLKSLYVVSVLKNQRVWETVPESNCPRQKAVLVGILMCTYPWSENHTY